MNSKQALICIKEKQYDIILMDINLGKEETGIDTIRRIREIDLYKNVPAIAMTAYAMDGDKEEFLMNGCTDYISKPFVQYELIEVIERALMYKN